jgi:hypothetical protein
VANGQDVRLLVRAAMQGAAPPEDSLLSQGWRRQHVLPHLLAILEGRSSLRITDVGAEAPFTISDS